MCRGLVSQALEVSCPEKSPSRVVMEEVMEEAWTGT